MKFFSFNNISLKTKLLSMMLAFSLIPIALALFYLMQNQSEAILKKTYDQLYSNNASISKLIDSVYYRNVFSTVDVLTCKRQTLEFVADSIYSVYKNEIKNPNDGVASIVKNIMFESATDDNIKVVIYNRKKPSKSIYVRQKYRHLLDFLNIYNTRFENFLKHNIYTSAGAFHELTNNVTGEPYLAYVKPVDEDILIVLAHNVVVTKYNFTNSASLIENDVNVIIKNARIENNKNNLTIRTFILNGQGNQIYPRDNVQTHIGIPRDVLSSIGSEGSIHHQGLVGDSYDDMSISYYNPMGWYIISSMPVHDIYNQKHILTIKLVGVGVIFSALALFATYMLLSGIMNPLRKMTLCTRAISSLDIMNNDMVTKFVRRLPKSEDEVGEISSAIGKMITNLSSNMRMLVDARTRNRQVETELNVATQIQNGMLPTVFEMAKFKPISIYGTLIPAKEVGGDLFDVISVDDDTIMLTIGDVSDKGVPASLFMAMTMTNIQECVAMKMSPGRVLTELNKVLAVHNPNMMFVTILIVFLSKSTGRITYANGGHCQPLVYSGGTVKQLKGLSGPAPGFVDSYEYKDFSAQIEPGSTIFMYTDGFSEAQNEEQKLYGDDRIIEDLTQLGGYEVKELCGSMLERISSFRGKAAQSDDITMLAVHLP